MVETKSFLKLEPGNVEEFEFYFSPHLICPQEVKFGEKIKVFVPLPKTQGLEEILFNKTLIDEKPEIKVLHFDDLDYFGRSNNYKNPNLRHNKTFKLVQNLEKRQLEVVIDTSEFKATGMTFLDIDSNNIKGTWLNIVSEEETKELKKLVKKECDSLVFINDFSSISYSSHLWCANKATKIG